MLRTIFTFIKSKRYQRYQISKIMAKAPAITLLRRLKNVSPIYVPPETSLERVKLVSVTYVPVGTSLPRLKLVGFIYVPVRRRKNVSNRSVLLTYQLRRLDDVSAWFRSLILVTKMDQFYLGTRHYLFLRSLVFQSH